MNCGHSSKDCAELLLRLNTGPTSLPRLPLPTADMRSVSVRVTKTGRRSWRRRAKEIRTHSLRGPSKKNRRLREGLNRERRCNTSREHINARHVPSNCGFNGLVFYRLAAECKRM